MKKVKKVKKVKRLIEIDHTSQVVASTTQQRSSHEEGESIPNRPRIGHSIQEANGPPPYPTPPTKTTTISTLILGILFGVFVFEFEFDKGFGYLENVFKYGFECEFSMNLKNFNDLFWVSLNGQSLCPPPQPTPNTPRPTNPTLRPIPNPREFCLCGYVNNVLLNVFEFENFLENEISVDFQHFENHTGMCDILIFFKFFHVFLLEFEHFEHVLFVLKNFFQVEQNLV